MSEQLWCDHCGKWAPRTHFYASGKPRCLGKLRWPMARRWELMGYIEQGYSDEQIAAKMGTTRQTIVLARRRYGIPSTIQVNMTAREVGRILGLSCSKAVHRWIAKGGLKATRARTRDRFFWVISRDNLEKFLANPNFWPAWHPERITDPHWRAIADRVRPAFIHYLTPSEAAYRLCIEVGTLNVWIHRGLVPEAVLYGKWWIPEHVLDQIQPPKIGGSRRGPEHVIAAVEPPPLGHPRKEVAA